MKFRVWCSWSSYTLIQRDENGYQFNNKGFDDISIFADTPEGMQKLLNVVQEITAWCGMQINVKKTYLLVIDNDQKRREQEPAPLLRIDGETLQAMNLDDAYRYLGYWGTGNGNMRATKEMVRQKIIAARDLTKYHPLTASNGIVHKQRYGSLPLLSGTHWVVCKWIERRRTIVRPSLQERLAHATVNSKCSL